MLALLRDLTCPVAIIIVVFLDYILYKECKFLFINSLEIQFFNQLKSMFLWQRVFILEA